MVADGVRRHESLGLVPRLFGLVFDAEALLSTGRQMIAGVEPTAHRPRTCWVAPAISPTAAKLCWAGPPVWLTAAAALMIRAAGIADSGHVLIVRAGGSRISRTRLSVGWMPFGSGRMPR
jgi:hypothetical protein